MNNQNFDIQRIEAEVNRLIPQWQVERAKAGVANPLVCRSEALDSLTPDLTALLDARDALLTLT